MLYQNKAYIHLHAILYPFFFKYITIQKHSQVRIAQIERKKRVHRNIFLGKKNSNANYLVNNGPNEKKMCTHTVHMLMMTSRHFHVIVTSQRSMTRVISIWRQCPTDAKNVRFLQL